MKSPGTSRTDADSASSRYDAISTFSKQCLSFILPCQHFLSLLLLISLFDFVQIELAAQIQDYLTQSSLSYCFELHNAFLLNSATNNSGISDFDGASSAVSEYSPLNSDVDTLFADYIHRGSMYAVQNSEEGGEYAIDMDEFIPLGHDSHKKAENKAGSNIIVVYSIVAISDLISISYCSF